MVWPAARQARAARLGCFVGDALRGVRKARWLACDRNGFARRTEWFAHEVGELGVRPRMTCARRATAGARHCLACAPSCVVGAWVRTGGGPVGMGDVRGGRCLPLRAGIPHGPDVWRYTTLTSHSMSTRAAFWESSTHTAAAHLLRNQSKAACSFETSSIKSSHGHFTVANLRYSKSCLSTTLIFSSCGS